MANKWFCVVFLHMLLFLFFSCVICCVVAHELIQLLCGLSSKYYYYDQLSSEGCIYLMILRLLYQMGYISMCGYERGAHDTPDCHCVPSSV